MKIVRYNSINMCMSSSNSRSWNWSRNFRWSKLWAFDWGLGYSWSDNWIGSRRRR